jgi:hypothetical protein
MNMETKFTFGRVLNIFFSHMTAGASELADRYVYRDRTLIYKWLRDRAFPSRPLIPDIIRFAMDKSSEATRPIIRSRINECIAFSDLSPAQKQELIQEEAFPDYLLNVINALAVLWKKDKGGGAEENESEAANLPPVTTCSSEDERQDVPPAICAAPPEDSPQPPAWDSPHQADRAIHITFSYETLLNIFLAAIACVAGDGLWVVLAWMLRWPGNAWMQGGGLPAFLWGLLFAFPVMTLALLPPRGAGPHRIGPGGKLLLAGGFSAAGGTAGFLLAQAGLGELFAGWGAAPAAKEILLVFISALVLTFLPTLALLALLRFPKTGTVSFLLMEFGPALLCVLFALPAILAGGRSGGTFWLGGFLAGAAAKLAMYLFVRRVLKGVIPRLSHGPGYNLKEEGGFH